MSIEPTDIEKIVDALNSIKGFLDTIATCMVILVIGKIIKFFVK